MNLAYRLGFYRTRKVVRVNHKTRTITYGPLRWYWSFHLLLFGLGLRGEWL